jgi:low temperature requirement protein LtrA
MVPRPRDELHRVASPLELLFDLTFVVGVAAITTEFAHRLVEGHAVAALPAFLQVFFAVWWAWMNATWFASSYDCDDPAYRLVTLVQMAGVLVLAAGIPGAFEDGDLRVVTGGYLLMRAGLAAQWLRAAGEDPDGRATAHRYALGIALVEVGWLLRLAGAESGVLPHDALLPAFLVLVALELSVPAWAERRRPTSWHPHHIAERYGLFAIILLGEGVLAASVGVRAAVERGAVDGPLVVVAASGLVLVFALWWLYFLEPAGDALAARRERSYAWGYGHYGIFAALAAFGAGVEAAVERTGGHGEGGAIAASAAIAIPVALYLLMLVAVGAAVGARRAVRPAAVVGTAGIVLALPSAAGAVGLAAVVAATAVACSGLVVATVLAEAGTSRGR